MVEVCEVDADWLVDEVEPTSVDDWLAVVELLTDWSPCEFTWTPGLMLAEAFTSELLMPTFAPTPTFGFTLSDGDSELPLVEPLVPADEVPLVLVPEVWADEVP